MQFPACSHALFESIWRGRPGRAVLAGAALAAGAYGCAPGLDWRDVRPAGSGVRMQFPCRPAAQQRSVALAGAPALLALHACSAGGQTWALALADVSDPARVGPALAGLQAAAAANVAATGARTLALRVPGATPNPASGRSAFAGRLPDGAAVQMQVAVFAHGTQVLQATVLGPALDDAAADNFFTSIRLAP